MFKHKNTRYFKINTIILVIFLFGCNQNNEHAETKIKLIANANPTVTSNHITNFKDKQEIQDLIREALNWSQSKNAIDLLPASTNNTDTVYSGFDLEKLKTNLHKLKKTSFFSSEFIENYNQIILTLDKKLRSKEFSEWRTGELPPFSFSNDVDVWCDCQDVPYDKPNPWNLIEVGVIQLNNQTGELYWKWGKVELNSSPDWKDFIYKFNTTKEDGKWKISYMQGFDFKASTKSDG